MVSLRNVWEKDSAPLVEPCLSDLSESLWVVGAIVSLRHGLSPGAELGSSLTSGIKR